MLPVAIDKGVHWIGINDRTLDLFEGLWPVGAEGVSYNAYLVADRKAALIDLARGTKGEEFFDRIEQLRKVSSIDYLVVNHLEPDHSGLLTTLRTLSPGVTILCTPKCKEMLEGFYSVTEGVHAVQDGETLSLGETELQFFHAPFLHWPETMVTFDCTHGILFSCDAFGGYGALQGALFDDEYADIAFYERQALRYFVNIIAKFCRPVLQAVEKLQGLDIRVVAPSHGLAWRGNPRRIVELYAKWAGYGKEPAEPGVTLVYGSMYGFTEQMMNAVASGISRAGVPMEIFDAARTHVSYILPSLWTRTGVVIGAPTYEGALFPAVEQVLQMAATKRVQNKKVARFGSYGWRGGAQRGCEALFERLKWEQTDVLEFCGKPTDEELRKGVAFGERFARMIGGG